MDKNSLYFKMFSECIPLRGANRAVIYDLPRNEFKFIPLEIFTILTEDEGSSFGMIKKKYQLKEIDESTLQEYFDFLDKNDYIFFCDKDELDLFPKISLQWDYEAIISNIFIEEVVHPTPNLVDLINETNCKDLVLKLNSQTHLKEFIHFLNELEFTKIKCIDIFLNRKENLSIFEYIIKEIVNYPRIRSIIFYNSSREKIIKGINGFGNIIFRKGNIENDKSFIDKSYFNVNTKLFTESQLHNTYFNKKLYIGPNGEIKNAPECEESFGNIKDLKKPGDIKKIVETSKFQKYWFVNKEICDVCKVCEFRHMCVDNRLPYKRKDDEWYHIAECNYNPFIAKWKGEEGYQTLAECGVISNEKRFSINHEKIAKINEELWNDE